MNDSDTPVYWIHSDLNGPIASSLCGLTRPQRFSAFLLDGRSADGQDGGANYSVSAASFAPGRAHAVLALLPEEDATKIFDRLSVYLNGRRAIKDLAETESEGAIAYYALEDGQAALLVVDINDEENQPLQAVWEELARVNGYGAHARDSVLSDSGFNPTVLLPRLRDPELAALRGALQLLTDEEQCRTSPKRAPVAR
jgi:hypothetical protein